MLMRQYIPHYKLTFFRTGSVDNAAEVVLVVPVGIADLN